MITISHEDGTIYLRFPYDESIINLIKDECHHRQWNPEKKVWVVGLADLETSLVPKLQANSIDYQFDESYLKMFAPTKYEPKVLDFKTKLPLYPYQIIGANKLVDNRRFCLFDSIGLGKTAQILAAINHLQLKNVLIFVPNSIKHQWVTEAKKFTDLKLVVIDGTPKKRMELWKSEGIKVVNYEKLRCKEDYNFIVNKIFDCIILDEATKIKNSQTRTSTAILNLNSLRKWVISGSPIENTVEDLHSIYKFVNPDIFGNYFAFRNNFLVTRSEIFNGREVELVVGTKNLDLLKKMIKPTSIRRTKSEVMSDLPPIVEKTIWIELNQKEEKWYSLLKSMVVEKTKALRKGISGVSFLGELQLMRSLCNGEACLKESKTQNPNVLEWLEEVGDSSTKIDTAESLLLDLLKENHSKIIVFSDFLVPLKLLKSRLNSKGIQVAELHGEVKNKEEQIEIFKKNDDVNVFLCQTKTGGYGLNLQESCSTIIFLNRPYNPATEIQCKGRVYRLGQKKKVSIFYISVSDSREEAINEILRNKTEMANQVLMEDKLNYI